LCFPWILKYLHSTKAELSPAVNFSSFVQMKAGAMPLQTPCMDAPREYVFEFAVINGKSSFWRL